MTLSSTKAGAYAAKLRDPRWQKKRLEALDRAGWVCEMCGDSESTLHVHHKQYLKGREPWEYESDQLASLCATCHKDGHGSPDLLLDVISRLAVDGPNGRDAVAMLIAGFVGQKPKCDFGMSSYWHLGNWHLGNVLHQMSCMSPEDFRSLMASFSEKSNRGSGHDR